MNLLKPGDSIAFTNEVLDLALSVPVSRSLSTDQRSPWPDGNQPGWTTIKQELEICRLSTFLLSNDRGQQMLEILAGRLVLRTHIDDDKFSPEKMLWLRGVRYASCFERKRFVVGGQPLKHLGIFVDDPKTLRRENKLIPVVGPLLKFLKPAKVEQNESDAAEAPLGDSELRLLDTLTAFVDAEYELEQLAAQREAKYHYHKVTTIPGRGRFKTQLRISLAEPDFKRFADADPPITMIAATSVLGEPVMLDVERPDTRDGATDLVVSMLQQGGKWVLPPSGAITRAASDTTRRVRLDTIDKLRNRTANNPWLVQIGSGTREPEPFAALKPNTPAGSTLNTSQREAVGKGLGSPDITLVLGPPGTGKTTVIHSWVEQFVKAGKRVLVTSQNNNAVDNVLDRLKHDKSLECVRLGNEAKILLVPELLIDNRAPELQKKLLGGIDKAVAELANALALLEALSATDDDSLLGANAMRDRARFDACVQAGAVPFAEAIGDAKKAIAEAHREVLGTHAHTEQLIARAGARASRPGLFGLLLRVVSWFEKRRARTLIESVRPRAIDVKTAYAKARHRLVELRDVVQEWHEALTQTRQQDLYPILIRLVDVVGATCIGVNTNKIFRDVDFDLVIVDESGQIQLHNLIVPLARAPTAILVGDHKQLPPVVQDETLKEIERRNETSLFQIQDELLRKSWFEIIWNRMPESHRAQLDTQFRCPPVISDFISDAFYDNRYFAGEAMKQKTPVLPIFTSCMTFVDTSGLPAAQRAERTRPIEQRREVVGNPCETRILVALLRLLCERLPEIAGAGGIGIIVPYKNHVIEVQRRIDEERRNGTLDALATPTAKLVASVDSYQGQERDIILFAFTRSNAAGAVGFLSDWRRLNVAMTRTKRQLIMVGDLDTLTKPTRNEREDAFKHAMRLLRNHLANHGQILRPDAIEGLH